MTQWGLDTLFNPAKRHMDEEKRRLQSTREELGDSSGGKRIDLESGKVTIRRPSDEDTEVDESGAESPTESPVEDHSDADAQNGAGASQGSKREPTPAAVRAARRRGRQPR